MKNIFLIVITAALIIMACGCSKTKAKEQSGENESVHLTKAEFRLKEEKLDDADIETIENFYAKTDVKKHYKGETTFINSDIILDFDNGLSISVDESDENTAAVNKQGEDNEYHISISKEFKDYLMTLCRTVRDNRNDQIHKLDLRCTKVEVKGEEVQVSDEQFDRINEFMKQADLADYRNDMDLAIFADVCLYFGDDVFLNTDCEGDFAEFSVNGQKDIIRISADFQQYLKSVFKK